MSDLNNFTVIGRLTKDAEMSVVGQKNSTLVKFCIANNTGFGNYAKTNFINVQVWGKAGEAVFNYLKKGKQVALSGTFENSKWTGQDGVSHDNWVLTSQMVDLLADSKVEKDPAQGTLPFGDSEEGVF